MSSTSEGRFEALLQKHGSTLFYVVVALFATAPAWIVKHPPLQDLPFHLATIRVVHDFGDPQLGFAQHYVLTFGRTQYVLYYLLGSILAYPLGVHAANVVLLSVYLGGTPLAIRALLRALGRDERLCLFSIPILVNVMFSFGLLPFIFGIPLMFTALWAAVVRSCTAPGLPSAPDSEWTWQSIRPGISVPPVVSTLVPVKPANSPAGAMRLTVPPSSRTA